MHKCHTTTNVCELLLLGTQDSNGIAKVSVLPRQYVDLKRAIISDVGVRADLDRHGHLCSGTAQGCRPSGLRGLSEAL
jgi:hypothetical protein